MSDTATRHPRVIRLPMVIQTYLTTARFLPDDLQVMVDSAMESGSADPVLELDAKTAERFRDEFTTRLARVGFGSDYEPTHEGKLLEELIDRFAEQQS